MNYMNFTVINKDNDKVYEVFDITYDKAGYPHFLLYKDGEWVRSSAKHFRPYTTKDMINDFCDELKNKNESNWNWEGFKL